MAEYYVVKDKNTSLYFRGKGVNRWGKHYNQASVYRTKANAENTVKEVSWRGEQAEVVPIQIIEGALDVADVVPKSEVERLITLNSQLEAKVFDERKAKADVAREIFEELENLLIKDNFRLICNRSAFAELKKKYTEGDI